jgi:hypothetical protein
MKARNWEGGLTVHGMAGGFSNMTYRHNHPYAEVRTSEEHDAICADHGAPDKASVHATEPRSPPVGDGSGDWKMNGEVGDGAADREAVRTRLRIAKLLSFTSGAGMVAWNKFASLWLLSVGLSPTGRRGPAVCECVWVPAVRAWGWTRLQTLSDTPTCPSSRSGRDENDRPHSEISVPTPVGSIG